MRLCSSSNNSVHRIPVANPLFSSGAARGENSWHRCFNTHSVHWWIAHIHTRTHMHSIFNKMGLHKVKLHNTEQCVEPNNSLCRISPPFDVQSLSACSFRFTALLWSLKIGKIFQKQHASLPTHTICTHRVRISVLARNCIGLSIERERERAKKWWIKPVLLVII